MTEQFSENGDPRRPERRQTKQHPNYVVGLRCVVRNALNVDDIIDNVIDTLNKNCYRCLKCLAVTLYGLEPNRPATRFVARNRPISKYIHKKYAY